MDGWRSRGGSFVVTCHDDCDAMNPLNRDVIIIRLTVFLMLLLLLLLLFSLLLLCVRLQFNFLQFYYNYFELGLSFLPWLFALLHLVFWHLGFTFRLNGTNGKMNECVGRDGWLDID